MSDGEAMRVGASAITARPGQGSERASTVSIAMRSAVRAASRPIILRPVGALAGIGVRGAPDPPGAGIGVPATRTSLWTTFTAHPGDSPSWEREGAWPGGGGDLADLVEEDRPVPSQLEFPQLVPRGPRDPFDDVTDRHGPTPSRRSGTAPAHRSWRPPACATAAVPMLGATAIVPKRLE